MSRASDSKGGEGEQEAAEGEQRFARALALLDTTLDWELLAHEHGAASDEGFFAEDQRDALVDTGLRFAADLAQRLQPRGRSLYLGAAVAELAPILFEALILRRDVCWLNLAGAECSEYQRAIGRVSTELSTPLPAPQTCSTIELPNSCRFDHLWLVSVLTDPNAFPGLHDELYQRSGTPASAVPSGLANMDEERSRALALAREALDRLDSKALITSTDEEWPLLQSELRRQSKKCELEQHARLSGLVGDPVRFGRLDGH